jgi:hypothetical protein
MIPSTKMCNICRFVKPYDANNFPKEKRNKSGLSGTCIQCFKLQTKVRNEKLKSSEKPKLEKLCCSVCMKEKPATTDYFHVHLRSKTGFKNSCKECRKIETHKYNISESCKAKARQRRKIDIQWKIKKNVGSAICNSIRKQNIVKNASCFKYLGYSVEELKTHLESQFEPWMNWQNWGIISTEDRTWNIDHIYPQSKLPYDSLEHPNFKKCWALENLRPLCSLKNIKKKDNICYEQ